MELERAIAFVSGGVAVTLLLQSLFSSKPKASSQRMSIVSTTSAPAAIGPYVQATKDSQSGLIFVSGQVGFIPGTKELDGKTAAAQAVRALQNIKAILEEAGSSMSNVMKTTVLLKNMEDYAAVNVEYEKAFGSHKPARAAFAVKDLPANALVEIECIALN